MMQPELFTTEREAHRAAFAIIAHAFDGRELEGVIGELNALAEKCRLRTRCGDALSAIIYCQVDLQDIQAAWAIGDFDAAKEHCDELRDDVNLCHDFTHDMLNIRKIKSVKRVIERAHCLVDKLENIINRNWLASPVAQPAEAKT